MARASTTSDAFSALGEPARRDILNLLGDGGEATVGELVARVRLTQPQVSKHLAVLRAVDLVRVRVDGRHRVYSVNAAAVRAVYDWIEPFQRLWNERFDRLDDLLVELAAEPTDLEQRTTRD